MTKNIVNIGELPSPEWIKRIDENLETMENSPFPVSTYQARVKRLRQQLVKVDAACYVVFRPSSIEYMCGFFSVETVPMPYLCFARETVLVVPTAEVGRAIVSGQVDTIFQYSPFEDGAKLLAQTLLRRIGKNGKVVLDCDESGTPHQFLAALRETKLSVLDAEQFVGHMRLILDEKEIDFVRKAADITKIGFTAGQNAAAQFNATDASVASAIHSALVNSSNSESALDVIVATGQRGSVPHSTWCNRAIDRSRTTFLEFSGTWHRYHAPVMRTIAAHGCALSPKLRRLEELSRATLDAVTANLRVGACASDVAAAAKRMIGTLEDWVIFHNNFGYPVGLAHSPTWMDGVPFYLTEKNHDEIKAGMVFHIPNSFRALGEGGVGLSQTVLVTETGTEAMTERVEGISYV